MHILIAGIHGYLGQLLKKNFNSRGDDVHGISRLLINGDTGLLKTYLTGVDVVINLSGAGILQRWTADNKKTIYNSRIKTTNNLVQAIQSLPEKDRPKKFIQTSAVGIYTTGNMHNEESQDFDDGFLGHVVQDWENACHKLPDNIEKHIFRLGLVIGKKAKTITHLKTLVKLGIAGPIGNGKQAFPFIHENDVCSAYAWAIEKLDKDSLFNLCAPQKITNSDFIKSMGRKMQRPTVLPLPALAMKIRYGEASTLLLKSPEVDSGKIQKAGFKFKYPDIDSALGEVLS